MFEFQPKISVFAASIRPNLWEAFFKSIEQNKIPFEVVFCGNLPDEVIRQYSPKWSIDSGHIFHYIRVGNIKPAQATEIARIHCEGELLHWTADDAEYSPNLLDFVWENWQSLQNKKTIVSCQTIEDHRLVRLENHRLFWRAPHTPQMAPLGFMSREFCDELGGIDRRYVSGQWDNDLILRAINAGGNVILFMDKGDISLDHAGKHGGNSGTFRTGYQKDREVLEGTWAPKGKDQPFDAIPFPRFDAGFEPFDKTDPDFYTKSQNFKGIWE